MFHHNEFLVFPLAHQLALCIAHDGVDKCSVVDEHLAHLNVVVKSCDV